MLGMVVICVVGWFVSVPVDGERIDRLSRALDYVASKLPDRCARRGTTQGAGPSPRRRRRRLTAPPSAPRCLKNRTEPAPGDAHAVPVDEAADAFPPAPAAAAASASANGARRAANGASVASVGNGANGTGSSPAGPAGTTAAAPAPRRSLALSPLSNSSSSSDENIPLITTSTA